MSQGKLIFTPPLSQPPPLLAPLIERLSGIGFLGAALAEGGYRVGERFMQLVSFMGCSPFLQLEPPKDGSSRFCQVHFNGPFDQPQIIQGEPRKPPRCPHCRRPLPDWQTLHISATMPTRSCHYCGTPLTLADLSWGTSAGIGRLFIEVWEIYPGDAVPVDALLAQLRGDGAAWHYFWQGPGGTDSPRPVLNNSQG